MNEYGRPTGSLPGPGASGRSGAAAVRAASPLRAALLAAAVAWGGAACGAEESRERSRSGALLPPAAATITGAEIRAHVNALAHDSTRGRSTRGPGLEMAVRYVAERFEEAGVSAAGEDGYRQSYVVSRVEPGPAAEQELVFRGPGGGESKLRAERDFLPLPVGPTARGEGPVRVLPSPSEVVSAPGGVLLVPSGARGILRTVRDLPELARRAGAAAALVSVTAGADLFRRVSRGFADRGFTLGAPVPGSVPLGLVRAAALPEALGRAVEDDEEAAAGWSAALRTGWSVERWTGTNVVGWLRGRDPEVRDEYVVVVAHLDHLGVGPPVDGDSIYNGADDNASGTAALLEVAEAFAAASRPPRRSIVFLAVSGEEEGLWGSRRYAERPPFPLDRTVAVVNMDMIGRNWRDTVAAIGLEHSSLGEAARRTARAHPALRLAVVGDRWPEEDFFRRSDHYSFARRGVPALFFFSGLHADYHRPSDEPGLLDYGKTARVARLVYLLTRRVADAPDAPAWNPDSYREFVEGIGENPYLDGFRRGRPRAPPPRSRLRRRLRLDPGGAGRPRVLIDPGIPAGRQRGDTHIKNAAI